MHSPWFKLFNILHINKQHFYQYFLKLKVSFSGGSSAERMLAWLWNWKYLLCRLPALTWDHERSLSIYDQ